MCEYIDMLEARGEARGSIIGEARGEARGITIGEARGEKRGETIGETRLAELIQALLKEKKFREIEAVSSDREKRHEMYGQYGI